jgi:DNA invertase Pin-like site-specific DNA recombinase
MPPHCRVAMKAIASLRVSTEEQDNSRLGLEAQHAAVQAFCEREGIELLDVVEEVASGGLDLSQRLMLTAALMAAKKAHAYVLVAQLERLSCRRAPQLLRLAPQSNQCLSSARAKGVGAKLPWLVRLTYAAP